MNKNYTKERIKLALIYFAILAFIVALYSFIVIQSQNQQFRRFDRVRENVERRAVPLGPGPFLTDEQQKQVEAVIEEIKMENLRNILILDAVLLFMGSFLAYYLSGRTLEPILETLNKQKRFVSDASHELKTPLTNIKTEAEVLNRSKSSTINEYKEFTSNTIDDINRLDELVTYLLDAARFENSSIPVNKEELELEPLVSSILKKFEKRAGVRNVQLVMSNGQLKPGYKVFADKNLLERLISIIIDNAIKYNKEGGEVRIEISSDEKNRTILKIADTGIGINPDDLPKVFDRFYRASEDRNEKGFGLGLSIAKQLAFVLQIDVEVDSILGVGTEFKLIVN